MRAFCHRTIFFLLMLAACRHQAAASTPDEAYARMREAFEKGAYREAQALGEGLISENHLSPQLFHLMGNTRYRQGDPARAALWYQRAALFPPPSAEIRQNLEHIHTIKGTFVYPGGTGRDQFAAWLSRSAWLTVATAGFWFMIGGVLFSIFLVRSRGVRTVLLTLSTIGFIAATLGTLGWSWHPSADRVKDLRVVTAPGVKAFTAATTTSGSVVEVPPGSQVRVVEDRGSWCYVEIPTGRDHETHRGWLQRESLAELWPFDRGFLE
jgi:hypothetical protein